MPSKPPLVSLVSTGAQVLTATGTSGKFTTAMPQGGQFMLITEGEVWMKVTATGGAAAPDVADNIIVNAGQATPLCNLEESGTTNSFVHVVTTGATIRCSLVGVAERTYP